MTNCNGNSSDCSTSSSSSSSSSSIALNTNMKTNSLSLNSPKTTTTTATNNTNSSSANNLNSNNQNSDISSSSTPGQTQVIHSQVTEKPAHYTYLKGFRVEQCSLFLQHKCTQHRPYTCFYWHFKNQRRRRPLRKRDGTFNYNPDTYCDKYDEQSGVCPNSDDCHFVHRNAGDTEKRYHLRYYKTATCIHETDAKGNCTKNGVHCAFAHGAADMRPPVYDIRELQPQQQSSSLSVSSISSSSSNSQQLQTNNSLTNTTNTISSNTFSYTNGIAVNSQSMGHENSQQNSPGFTTQNSTDLMNEKTLNLSSSLERERLLNEDPKWNDTAYVLNNYKTEQCRRPPRLCRQGFACPQYHNARDKRRNPSLYKYRSTPCPNVKQGDDWLEPTVCENGDLCKYCHSRTEQQFHPEIYKSSKCNDMISTGYCPRGPFCAFAHIEQELKNQRAHSNSESSNSDYTLENFISNAMPNKENENYHDQNGDNTNLGSHQTEEYNNYVESTTASHVDSSSNSHLILQNGNNKTTKTSNLILQQQMLAAANACSYNKPIGSERERPKSQTAQQHHIQPSQHSTAGPKHQQSNQLESDNNNNNNSLKNQSTNGNSNQNSQQTSSSSSNSNNNTNSSSSNSSSSSNNNNNSSSNTSNTNTILNEIEHNNNSTIEKLRHDLFRQAEVSNKLETLCLQYRQWVEKLTIDVNEWKAKYIRCETEKKNLEVQLFNKLSLEQSIAPLRNANFNLNGNSNDLIDGSDLTKLLSFSNNNNNNNNSNNNNNNNSLNNKINGINKK